MNKMAAAITRLAELDEQGPVLSPRNPVQSAQALVAERSTDGRRSLHRHRGAFWDFRVSHYVLAEDEAVRAEVWKFLAGAVKLNNKDKTINFEPTTHCVSGVLDALKAVCALDDFIESPSWLDGAADMPPANEFLAVANGLLHLPKRELYPATPDYFGLSASGVTFDNAAKPPTNWLKFLGELFGDDFQSIEALQDWFGYVLSPDTSQHKILLVVGPTRSGKGTIARVLGGIVGRGSVVAPTLASLAGDFGHAPLIGKPLAIISDARLSGRSDQAIIAERLLSVSGEDALTINRKFKGAWNGRLSTRFILMTNELPNLADSSGALAKRFIVLALKNSFYGKEDLALAGTLLKELPGILNWALDGYERLGKRGYFIQPESANDAINDLEALTSPVKSFLSERCHIGELLEVTAADLYQAWCDWCEENGRKPGPVQMFGRNLRAALPSVRIQRRREGQNTKRVYQGLELC